MQDGILKTNNTLQNQVYSLLTLKSGSDVSFKRLVHFVV